jgi:dolichyl-phosphate-mannose--protein O-mannosyl transferase
MSIYVACFVAHFRILTNSGPGDAHMSSLFQANLNGTDFSKNPLGKKAAPFLNQPLRYLICYIF